VRRTHGPWNCRRMSLGLPNREAFCHSRWRREVPGGRRHASVAAGGPTSRERAPSARASRGP
jgi:hypothetical protein